MYSPKQFTQVSEQEVRKLIDTHPFATLLSYSTEVTVNHLPIIFGDEPGTLIGHMSRKNPQWEHFQNNPQCLAVFHGPHAYISPKWYKSGRDVPTWNYAVVHVHGKMELVEDFAGQVETLKMLSSYFEKASPLPWKFELPADLLEPAMLTRAIISFRIRIKSIEAKFKFSQNRSREDQAGVIEGLAELKDDQSRLVREMMQGYLNRK